MRRKCEACGRPYEATRSNQRMCSSTCRSRKARGAAPAPRGESPLVKATKAELVAAGKLDSMLGQQAIALAARMSTETSGGVAGLSRELRTVMAAAIGSVPAATPAPGAGDEIDELRARRTAKQAG